MIVGRVALSGRREGHIETSECSPFLGHWSDYETMMTEKFGKDLTPYRLKYRTLKG